LEKEEDLDKQGLDNFCKENGFIGWFVLFKAILINVGTKQAQKTM
jgi:hypothetical protein